MGTITAAGLYTAPQDMPAQGSVIIQATSQADSTKSATASVTVSSDIVLTVSPASASVELGATAQFAATIQSAGNPDRTVTWSVAGAGCSSSGCGTVDSTGRYTGPQILPAPPGVILRAKSNADPTKISSASLTITSNFTLSISGPAALQAGAAAQYLANLTPAPNSNPSLVVSWSVSGANCASPSCGTISPNGNFVAPQGILAPLNVVITATPQADPSRAASLPVTIQPASSISINPTSATLAVNHRQTFIASFSGGASGNLQWAINGVVGGNATVGQICAVGSNPCQPPSAGATSVDYIAPGSMPVPNPVTLTAANQANPAQMAAATITILSHVVVSVSPFNVTLAPQALQAFRATVSGTSNQNVTWQVAGTACGSAGNPCGTIDATGIYTAPLLAPNPNTLSIVAISADDPTRSGMASVTLAIGPVIVTLLPSSATAGSAGGFTLRMVGANFSPSSPGPGASVIVNGAPRTTNCPDAYDCTTILSNSDLAAAGMLSIQVQNPNGALSNQVSFIVLADAGTQDVIVLTPGALSAPGKDITVVDLSTSGNTASQNPVELNVAALGIFSAANNTCTLAGNPLFLVRPPSGTTTANICAFSASGLDPGMTYLISGPTPNDLTLLGAQPLGLGIIQLTLQFRSTTLAGARTLFIQNANKNKTAASGAIQVK